jgi:hypothetical protein
MHYPADKPYTSREFYLGEEWCDKHKDWHDIARRAVLSVRRVDFDAEGFKGQPRRGIYLTEELHSLLANTALNRGLSTSELVREAVHLDYLEPIKADWRCMARCEKKKQIIVRFSPFEWDWILSRCADMGLQISQYVRLISTAFVKPLPKTLPIARKPFKAYCLFLSKDNSEEFDRTASFYGYTAPGLLRQLLSLPSFPPSQRLNAMYLKRLLKPASFLTPIN